MLLYVNLDVVNWVKSCVTLNDPSSIASIFAISQAFVNDASKDLPPAVCLDNRDCCVYLRLTVPPPSEALQERERLQRFSSPALGFPP